MTLTIELPPDLEERLGVEAARRGVSPAEALVQVVDAVLPSPSVERPKARPFHETATVEEWLNAFREWGESHRDWPRLPSEALERENFYEERIQQIIGVDPGSDR